MSHWITSKFPGVIAAMVVLSIGVCSVQRARTNALLTDDDWHAGSNSTLRTEHLQVDESAVVGGDFAAGLVPLELRTKTAATKPLDFIGGTTNKWDLSVATGSNTDPATITVFANTPTTTPSVDSTLTFAITPGTGGAQGVWLRPNGTSFFDPDGFAGDAVGLVCIGAPTPAIGAELDVSDTGNQHAASRTLVGISATSHYDTTGGAITAYGLRALAINDRTSGSSALTNENLFDAANAQTNNALATERGDVILNRTSGSTFALGAFKPSLLTLIAPTICDTSITPSSLTSGSSTNNYDLTATMGAACHIRLSTDSTWPPAVITGFVPPSTPGGKIWIVDNIGNGPIVLAYNSGSSSAGNKIFTEGDGAIVLDEWSMGYLYYDSSISAWRFIGGHPEHETSGGRVVTSITCNGTGTADCLSTSCTDTAGTIETNTGATSCTITFVKAWAWAPICNVTSRGALSTALSYTPGTGTLVIADAVAFPTNNPLDYQCIGPRGVQ